MRRYGGELPDELDELEPPHPAARRMLAAIIGLSVIALLLSAGFWLTRGGGGAPGGINDPATEMRERSLRKTFLPPPGREELPDRDHEGK